ncbi:hypothetical protein [Actinomadura madurae]|uniref:hypothetical protein n=1 Tax=Actinomadura madurae TaxID=1993 RepID=UPI0020D240E7|nr:hypothetical protein [Actinomadura madurae]MCP9978873.1 hypothetical protein [Actinomadura madurae]
MRLADRQPPAAFVKVVRGVEIAFEQRDAAEARQASGDLRPEPEFLGVAQAALVQFAGTGVVAGDLREKAEGFGGLEVSPAVTRLAEQLQGLLAVPSGPVEVACRQRLCGPGGERRRLAPDVAGRAEALQRAGRQLADRLQVTEPGPDEPEEPSRPGIVVGGQRLADPRVAVRGVAVEHREPGVPGPGRALTVAPGTASARSKARRASPGRPHRNQAQPIAFTSRSARSASPPRTAPSSAARRFPVSARSRRSASRWPGPRGSARSARSV